MEHHDVVGQHHETGEEAQHHEKGPAKVLKKVKQKAKKLKNTLTGHGHGHEHEHEHERDYDGVHSPDDHDLDEEDDEDDEMVIDPEVHGAPIYDSSAVPSRFVDQPDPPRHPAQYQTGHPDRLTGIVVNEPMPHDLVPPGIDQPSIPATYPTGPIDPLVGSTGAKHHTGTPDPFVGSTGEKHHTGPPDPFVGSTGLDRVSHPTKYQTGPHDPFVGETELDRASPAKHQTGLHDPFVGETQLDRASRPAKYQTGQLGHGHENPMAPHNTPVPLSTGVHQAGESDTSRIFKEDYPGQEKINLDRPRGLEEDPDAPKDTVVPSKYQSKVTDPTGKGSEEVGITGILRSMDKLGISDDKPSQHEPHLEHQLPMREGRTFDNLPTGTTPENKAANQSGGYMGMITSATSAVAGTAVSAKNVVASKLGYGEKVDHPIEEHANKPSLMEGYGEKGDHPIEEHANKPASNEGYGTKIASTVTGTLAPVYEKVKETGSSVISKLPGSSAGPYPDTNSPPKVDVVDPGTRDEHLNKPPTSEGYGTKIASTLNPLYEKVEGTGSSVISKLPGTGTGTKPDNTGEVFNRKTSESPTLGLVEGEGTKDKGVSMRDYIAEKLKPGEEDKALSEAISGTLHKKKEESKPKTKVTESEVVIKRLGPFGDDKTDDNKNQDSTFVNSPGSASKGGGGMVDKLKGTISSWLGQTDGSQQGTAGATTGPQATPHQSGLASEGK